MQNVKDQLLEIMISYQCDALCALLILLQCKGV